MSTVHTTNTSAAPADALSEAFAGWKKTVEAELKGAPFEKKLVTRTLEGIALQPLYTRADLASAADLASQPGQAPFLRGTRAAGYRDRRWECAQEIAARTPDEFNAALRGDLMRGQDSVIVTPESAHRPGLRVTNLDDLRRALGGVELSAIAVHVDAGADPLPLAALMLGLAEERGVAWDKLTGTLAADPLGEWAATGKLPDGIGTLYDSLAEWTTWAANHASHLRTIGVNSRVWADAGGTAVQELALALASATEYLRAMAERDVELSLVAPRFRFQFAIGPQFFTEVAKFRAWRPLWTRVLSAFQLDEALAAQATVHAATGRWNQTLLDAHVNMLRVTTEALSAVLGGCDSLHIAPFDEVTGSTDDFSRRIARNVHTLLAEEFGFAQTADPAGGSWYVEKLTDEIARKAWDLFQKIESRGGLAAALREGVPQQWIAEAMAEKAEAVGKRRLGLIGTNLFPNLKEKPLAPKPTAASPKATAGAKPARGAKAKTSTSRAKSALSAAPTTWPATLEAALAAAHEGATVTELAGLSRPGAKPDWEIPEVTPWRASAGFEELRAAAERYAERTGKRPRVFLAKMGPALQHKARADFSAGFFATGGFEIVAKQSFDTAKAAADAATASGAPIAVLCSTDETYPELVPAFAAAAKAARKDLKIVLAGLPAEPAQVAAFRAAGIDEFIHVRANVHAVLATFLKQIGALA